VTTLAPPAYYRGTPSRHVLKRGTCLWRVHSRSYSAPTFKCRPSDGVFGGARFDSTPADVYPYWYAALTETTAVAETLLRDLPFNELGTRALSREAVTGRKISGLTLTRDLDLVSLVSGPDLAAVAQDYWLVTASGNEYAQTRAWAHWLRRQAGWAHGFLWSSLRDPAELAIILFGDRCADAFGRDYETRLLHEIPELTKDLDDKAGAEWLNGLLEPYRVEVPLP
jgi:RES domain